MMKLDYFLYITEAEGLDQLVDTREARINAAVKDFIDMARAGHDINDNDIQAVILEDHNLQDISTKESERIAKEVKKEYGEDKEKENNFYSFRSCGGVPMF